MSIDPTQSTAAAALVGGGGAVLDPAAQAARRAQANEEARQATIAEIKEKGFSAYVAELEEEKKEKMREEILQSMGLSEDQLAEMPAEARAAIEDAISQEIQRRMNATSTVENKDEDKGNGDATASLVGVAASPLNTGNNVLQVLQDVGGRDLGDRSAREVEEEGVL
jgi:hypothetical protein